MALKKTTVMVEEEDLRAVKEAPEHITTRNVNRRAAHSVNDWLLGQERTLRVLIPEL
ncbi:hypothetical protein [Streptomyces sp. SID10853]|uniref:hypothetical protein n=1 Tax=Streptomyces sp. SID10853 TaxID=2706028 RepID=UPI001EF331A5|nr:hypothetical protein [Streptomyces sp. SID10853]